MASVGENLRNMVRVFRRECYRVLESERTTIRGSDEMLMALQLTMAEVNKRERGEFGVVLSDVLLCWKCLLLDRLQLPDDGSSRPENYELIRREYESFLKRTNTMDLIDVYDTVKQLNTDPGDLLTPMELLQFILGAVPGDDPGEMSSLPPCPSTPSSQPRPGTAQMQRVVRGVFCSYLGLLAVTSFVRAIQLGGKGYAPSESDPLRKHLKGLTEFVHFHRPAGGVAGGDPRSRVAAVESWSTARWRTRPKALREHISLLHSARQQASQTLATGISPARPKAYAINHATAYIGRDTVKVLLDLLDAEALAPPCRNKAELLTEDQAVLNGSEGSSLLTLYKSPEVVTGTSPKPLRTRVQAAQAKGKVKERGLRSQFACTYVEDGDLPLNRVLDFPSTSQMPTCKHPAPKRPTAPPRPLGPSALLGLSALDRDPQEQSAAEDPPYRTHSVATQKLNSASIEALGSRHGNAKSRPPKDAQRKKTRKADVPEDTPLGGKSVKRKQAEGADVCGDENQPPPAKRAPPKALGGPPGKKSSSKAPAKKLITGQGKLTSFFRL
ncbi:hypothetical protein ACEWY4_002271 [Coilia grayii]|uniref:PCNA-interacting partner n=1 Tax=Coilia grayii TaxID=363190 RepID=A0ABD1KVA6_9TELE